MTDWTYFNWNDSEWDWGGRKMTAEDIAESCERTAEILEGHWTKGAWWRYDPDEDDTILYCVEGGLAAALGLDYTAVEGSSVEALRLRECPVYKAVLDTVNLKDPGYGMDELPNWNDADSRTEQDVLDILHATAKRVLGVES